jgi:hypothetical protein
MQGVAEFWEQVVRFACGAVLYGFIAACVCTVLMVGHRWNTETARQDLWIKTHQLRWEHSCTKPDVVYDLKFQSECLEYDEIRHQSARTRAGVVLLREWSLCDPENGGCRGFFGFLVGAVLMGLVGMHLLRRLPDYLCKHSAGRDLDDTREFMYAHSGTGKSKHH